MKNTTLNVTFNTDKIDALTFHMGKKDANLQTELTETIQKLYEKYQAEEDPEVVILGVAAPDYGDEGSREEIAQFLEENGYTYPVVMDEGGELFMTYGVFSYPTTFMIDRDGNVFGYAAGQLSMEMMESIIRQTVTGVREQPGQ